MSRKACLVPHYPLMLKETQTRGVKPPAEEQIDRAVERVYEKYGPHLSVFFKAVQNQGELELEQHEQGDHRRGY